MTIATGGHRGAFARRIVAVVVLAASLGVAGCAKHESLQVNASGALSGVVEYPGSTSFSAATVTGDVTVQSFKVGHATPTKVLQWYASHLPGWTETAVPAHQGTNSFIGTWSRDSRKLQVSSVPAPSTGDVQYSLVGTTNNTALP